MTRFEGQVAIVTGAASGIGEAVAHRLRDEGATVIGADLYQKGNAARVLDVADESAWKQLIDDVEGEHGRIDVLVNVAGTTGFAPFHELERDEWDRIIGVNQNGTFFGMKHALRAMLPHGSGAIVNIASIFATEAVPALSAYHTSKAAVVGMTRNAAITYAPYGIRVNAVAPGWIATPMTASQPDELNQSFIGSTPLGRGGQPTDIASSVAFLASPEAGFITGVVLPVDGGYLAR